MLRLATAGVVLCGLSACASQPSAPMHPVPDKTLSAFASGEHITRSDVVAQLGPPRATFENGRVIAYRLGKNGGGYYVVSPLNKTSELDWQGVEYNLMLRFDDQGVLQEHSLIATGSHIATAVKRP